MGKNTINVEGMSCSHCEAAVNKGVGAIEGVKEVSVSLNTNTVTVEYDESKTSLDAIKSIIVDLGYDVIDSL